MDGFTHYPAHDFGPVMKGLIIGGMGIVHVFLAQFAIGGGMLLTYFEHLRGSGKSDDAGLFVDGFFQLTVLASFVLGAMTGVGMWLTSIQISPRTIGEMVRTFHWVWGIEWTFFAVEVVCGYTFYRYGSRLGHRRRMQLLVLYSAASWFSLFWINGILSWQLTPGEWVKTRSLWAGFFNPSFWPSLVFRTVACMAIASLAAAAVINVMDISRPRREALLRYTTRFLAPMLIMPIVGIWYLWSMPADSRAWVHGGSPAMNLFFMLGAGASTLIALYALALLRFKKLYINGATALLLVALAFGATAGGEFVREGARKPFTIRAVLYSNSIGASEVAQLRRDGCTTGDPYPLDRPYPQVQLELGARVFRVQCSVCHTISGMNGVVHLAGGWRLDQQRLNIAKLQHTKAYMPPFAGTPAELEALVQLIRWHAAGEPEGWPRSEDAAVERRIARFLADAGTAPGGKQ